MARKKAEEFGPEQPYGSELLKHDDDSVVSGQHAFARLAIIQYDMDGIEHIQTSTVTLEDFAREITLERRETKTILAVALEDELHKPIT
jgi:hypothetical protein